MLRALDTQSARSSRVIHDRTARWRRLRWGGDAPLIAIAPASVKVTDRTLLQAGWAIMLGPEVLVTVARWRINHHLRRFGTDGGVSPKRIASTMDRRVFQARASLPSVVALQRDHLDIRQGQVQQRFAYEDRGLMMTLGDGLLQILPDEDRRDVADVVFVISARALAGLEVAQQVDRVLCFYVIEPESQGAAGA